MAGYATGTSRNGQPWLCSGEGPNLLLYFPGLNDALADVRQWPHFTSALIKSWTRRHRVCVISRRPGMPAGYSIGDMTRDYAETAGELIEECRPPSGKALIAGVSMGGLCALQFAHDYPGLTEAAGVHSAAHRPHPRTLAIAEEWQQLARAGRWHELYHSLNNATFSGLYRLGFSFFSTLLSPWLRQPPAHADDFIHSIEACRHFDLSRQLADIRKPVQMIAGDQDQLFPVALLRECASHLPDGSLELIPGGGHGVLIDHKRAFDAIFTVFLQRNEQG